MENKMKNILLLGLLAVFLSSCSESVQEIQVTTVEVSKTPLKYALFAVEDTGYEKIQVNYTDIRNKLAEQKQLLLAYKEYYETPEGEEAE